MGNTQLLYKKPGRRRNAAPYKNCNQFFDVALIICDFGLKVKFNKPTDHHNWLTSINQINSIHLLEYLPFCGTLLLR